METYFTTIKERILHYTDYKGFSKEKFFEELGVTYGNFKGKAKEKALSSEVLAKIVSKYPELNSEWLLTGKGIMLKSKTEKHEKIQLIPLYDDFHTTPANTVADAGTTYQPNIQVNAGDWFKGATAAIRYYEDNLIEYPNGCILIIKSLANKDDVVWGRNYVIETADTRMTRKIISMDDDHILCYSTNPTTFPDGTLIHQPVKIPKKMIKQLSKVLGSIIVEETTGKINLL